MQDKKCDEITVAEQVSNLFAKEFMAIKFNAF